MKSAMILSQLYVQINQYEIRNYSLEAGGPSGHNDLGLHNTHIAVSTILISFESEFHNHDSLSSSFGFQTSF
jgi:hypothetical protein